MDIKEMDLKDYCCLNRYRFIIDPESDAEWYFGNEEVNNELLTRINNDFLIRGVPKCGILGRFGYGKTHTLCHLKFLFTKNPTIYPAVPLMLRIAPYDEATSGLGGWKYIHGKMLDSMGEYFLREIVRGFDSLPSTGTGELSSEMQKVFKFGDENLKSSLSSLLAAFFLRDVKSTMSAWQWLKGDKLSKSSDLDDIGVKKNLDTANDMLNVILNIGTIVRKVKGCGIVFLMDEAQSLDEVKKSFIEIHDAFLQLAEHDNSDVGFVFAYFGTGLSDIPKVIAKPDDILSRLGVTQSNIQVAIKDLQRLIVTRDDMRDFIDKVLKSLIDAEKSKELINKLGISDKVNPNQIPFTEEALNRITQVMYEKEPNRNARMIIQTLASLSAEAYQKGKKENQYVIADEDFIEQYVRDI